MRTQWLLWPPLVPLLSSALLLLVVIVGASLPFHPERALYRWLEWHPYYGREWWGPTCDRLVTGLLLPGALGFVQSVQAQWRLHRGLPLDQQRWLAALALTVAANGLRIGRIFLLFGAANEPRTTPAAEALKPEARWSHTTSRRHIHAPTRVYLVI